MIQNLPTNQSPQVLQDKITSVLCKVFNKNNDQSFVKVRVVGDYSDLYSLCVDLKRNIEKLRFVHSRNDELRQEGLDERVQRKSTSWLCCCAKTVDSEHHYLNKIGQIKETIKKELKEKEKSNIGKGFLMFSDDQIVKDLRYNGQKYFSVKIR